MSANTDGPQGMEPSTTTTPGTDALPAPAVFTLPPPGFGVVDTAINQELADSYLTYAMSTIVDRALPDVRDGLKPSQRRILVAMNDLNLSPGRKHSKCAGIVGETMKKYHPHGDQAIYPTLVNMAQEWKFRCLMIDKQGNFGSLDPDPPAAMRYTEARLHQHAMEMLEDLKLDTVDWQSNFDEQYEEPKVLPAKFPNLLVNGSTGIAVGMACSIPPHNLGEMCDAIVAVLENPELSLAELMRHVPGPDFPTGGVIMGRKGIAEAYATGRGKVIIRAKIDHEHHDGRDQLVIKEVPFQVTKNDAILAKIKECKNNGKLDDVSDVPDESSNRTGMRLVVKLKRGADPKVVENQLYQLTPLQTTFSIINIALVKGQPRTLPLKTMIQCYIDHRIEIVRRRTAFRLRKALQEAHRVEGLIHAVCDIDEVIKLIRASRTRDEAIEKLMARAFRIAPTHPYAPKIPQRLLDAAANDLYLSRIQAEAIGRLQLIQLVGLEIDKLVEQYRVLLQEIEEYESILASHERVRRIIKDEVIELKTKYADPRRSRFSEEEVGDFDLGALTPEQTVVVTISREGYVKRSPADVYRTQGRGGRGVIGADSKEGDVLVKVFVSSTHDDLLCFTTTGRVFKMKVYEIPEGDRTSRGRNIVNLLDLKEGEKLCEYMPIEDFEKEETYLVFATSNGVVKRTALKDYRNVNRSGIIALGLREGDSLIGVTWTNGADHLLLGASNGMAIRFGEDDVRQMGRAASGVRGIDIDEPTQVVGLVRATPTDDHDLLTVCANGYGKRTPLSEYLVQQEDGTTRVQGRGGKGRRDIEASERNGPVVALLAVKPEDDLVIISSGGMLVRISASEVRQTGRGTQGVRMINLIEGETVASIARVVDAGKEAENAAIRPPKVVEAQAESQAPEVSNASGEAVEDAGQASSEE